MRFNSITNPSGLLMLQISKDEITVMQSPLIKLNDNEVTDLQFIINLINVIIFALILQTSELTNK